MDMLWFLRQFVCCLEREKAAASSPTASETHRFDHKVLGAGALCTAASPAPDLAQVQDDDIASSTQEASSRRSSAACDEDTDEEMPLLEPVPSLKPDPPQKANAKLTLFKQSVAARARGAPASANEVRTRLAAMQAARR
eukprot:TRINITY_DN66740_c0_g1_i1.p1 TRINITY_DN66740_c0_g1~~TRINITY_DN66740_c0_g1_i1.p1  ORF type:complete len:139 (+),score=39.46 TRINITY_DN66740_c0_g1_i1:54-470(+)